jgi:hypothetical protein
VKARLNPFASKRLLQIRYELQQESWTQLLQRLAQFNYRAAIVGPEGSGKTTLLEDIALRLRNRFVLKWFTLSVNQRELKIPDIRHNHLILLDGFDLLPPWKRKWLLWKAKNCHGLIVTAHSPTTLPTLVECSTTPELLDRISKKLVESPQKQLNHALFQKHQGNLRDVFRELYDIWAALT